jgi:hypothetical protein
MNENFRDVLAELLAAKARFLVVGAHALAVHGVPRATGDLDVWVEADPENAERVWAALVRFGAPVESMKVTREDLVRPDTVVQIGLPPNRIDILTSLTGVAFPDAWTARVTQSMGTLEVPFIGRETLVRNKRATGRTRDLADLEDLGEKP